jgi:Flp pilus assembly protein TadG
MRMKRVKKIVGRLRRLRRSAHHERGTALAELAIVLPLFAVLFAATAEFGRFYYGYTTLAKASRVGARYLATAAVNGTEDATAKNLVVYGNVNGTGTPVMPGLTTANVTITRAGGVAVLPQTVTIQVVNYKYQPLFDLGKLINSPTLTLNIDMKPSVTMRYLLTQPPL